MSHYENFYVTINIIIYKASYFVPCIVKWCQGIIQPCDGRAAAAAANLWAPPLTFVDRRSPAAADNLSARRRCHCCCVVILLQFSMTKKGHQKILRIGRNFFSGICEKYGSCRRRYFST